jgi:hypothetical protein
MATSLFSNAGGFKKKPVVSTGAKPAYGGSYVGGIPNQGSATTTRLADLPTYKAYVAGNKSNPAYQADPVGYTSDIISYVNSGGVNAGQQAPAGKPPPKFSGAAAKKSGGGGGGRRGGGGGGGGGGGSAAAAAQAQIDAMTRLLGSGAYTYNATPFDQSPYDTMRTNVNNASAQDQQAATGAYNNLDTWLQANQTNPYANVKVQQAAVAPSYNPYLESQGIAGSAPVVNNPNDGGYGAFQNVLALLGANQQANNASGLRASQEARTYAGQQIGGLDNAYLANIGTQQTQAQQAYAQQQLQLQQQLAAEKRQAAMQMMALLATPGTTAPDLAALGIA